MHDPPVSADDRNAPPVTSLDPRTASAIAIGGVVGATLRFTIGEVFSDTDDWPWAVFVVNIVGCAALGWLVARRAALPDRVFAAAAIGFCGGLTTFSAFAVDLAVMARDDRLGLFAGYLLSSFACGLVAYAVGRRMGNRREPMAAPS
ncbi:MAG: fluoride efflux transporter FluC [Acidimicrobiales bacterium]